MLQSKDFNTEAERWRGRREQQSSPGFQGSKKKKYLDFLCTLSDSASLR